ncbi:hypothetical protein Dimus_006025 [Dionaea muscipula]
MFQIKVGEEFGGETCVLLCKSSHITCKNKALRFTLVTRMVIQLHILRVSRTGIHLHWKRCILRLGRKKRKETLEEPTTRKYDQITEVR